MNKLFGRYCCANCGKLFRTGKFDEDDLDIYDDVCPYCGALADTPKEYFICSIARIWHKIKEVK